MRINFLCGTLSNSMGFLCVIRGSFNYVTGADSAHLLQEGYLSIKMPDSRRVVQATQSCQLGEVSIFNDQAVSLPTGWICSSLTENTKQWTAPPPIHGPEQEHWGLFWSCTYTEGINSTDKPTSAVFLLVQDAFRNVKVLGKDVEGIQAILIQIPNVQPWVRHLTYALILMVSRGRNKEKP